MTYFKTLSKYQASSQLAPTDLVPQMEQKAASWG